MIRVEASALADALKAARPALASSHHLPVLSGVHLETTDGALAVTISNLDVTITERVPCSDGELAVIVPARQFEAWCSRVGGAVSLTLKDAELVAEAGGARLELRTMRLGDWPAIPHPDGEPIDLGDEPAARIGRVLHGAARGKIADSKPQLRAVRFADGVAVTTDSYRLAAITMPGCPMMQVDAEHLRSLPSGPVSVIAAGTLATFTTPTGTRTMRQAAGDFPQVWRSLLRESSTYHLRVERQALLDALSIVSLSSTPVTIEPDNARVVRVTSTEIDVGRTEALVSCDTDVPHPLEFNLGYLRDLLSACVADELTLEVEPGWKLVQVVDDDLTQLLMPLKPR